MRWLCLIVTGLSIMGCSRAPDAATSGETASGAAGVAFAYWYGFRIPSARISDVQEAHARACEQMAERCRITGMTFRLDGSGQVAASLDVRLAAPVARAFGRRSVRGVEAAGGALTGAEIVGTDALPPIRVAQAAAIDDDLAAADIDAQLARDDLTPAVRSDLAARRTEVLRSRRGRRAEAAAARGDVSTTPMRFEYAAGSGVGLTARLSEAAHDGYVSLTWTIATVLTLLAYLGPPALLLLLLWFFWDRVGRRWWQLAFPMRSGD